MSEQFTSNKSSKLRAAVVNNPTNTSSLRRKFEGVPKNDQYEVDPESGMSSAEKGAAYKEWGRQLAEQSKERDRVAAQNAVTKGGTRRKRKTLRKRKSKRKSKRKRG
jgi:hypothetical protein